MRIARRNVQPILGGALVLLLGSVAGVGYHIEADISGPNYGHLTTANRFQISGTIASAVAAALAPFFFSRRPGIVTPYFVLSAYTVLSGVWSYVFFETAYQVGKSAVYAMAFITIARNIQYKVYVISLTILALTVAGLTTALCLSDPIFTTSYGAEGWRGVFAHKNGLGAFCTYMVVLLSADVFARKPRVPALSSRLATAALIPLVVLSNSYTSIVLTVGFLIFAKLALAARARSGRRLLRITFAITLIVAPFMPLLIEGLLAGEITLTGRTKIWAFYWAEIMERPFFGAGGATFPLDEKFSSQMISLVGGAALDSSYMILLLNLGIIGFLLWVLCLGYIARRLYLLNNDLGTLTLCGLAVYLGRGLTEGGSQFSGSLGTTAILILVVHAELAAKARRRGRFRLRPRGNGARVQARPSVIT